MQDQKDIIDCYDKTARNYADKFGDELAHKHFDQLLLNAFVAENIEKGKCTSRGSCRHEPRL